MLKITLDQQGNYPLHAQLKERVKLALAFGELRPGDTLPSIRELAHELSVGPGIVRRAYGELARAGIVTLSRSKRVVVNSHLNYKRDEEVLETTRRLAADFSRQVAALGVHPQAFAQFFQHWLSESRCCDDFIVFTECNRKEAEQYAKQASCAWGVNVRGLPIDELEKLPPSKLRGTRYIVTTAYHYEEVRKIAKKLRKGLVSISVTWDEQMLQRIRSVPAGGRVAFVFERADCDRYGRVVIKEMEKLFSDSDLAFACVAIEEIEELDHWLQEENWDLVYFSNRLWESLPEAIRSKPNVSDPRLKADPLWLERARIEVGVFS